MCFYHLLPFYVNTTSVRCSSVTSSNRNKFALHKNPIRCDTNISLYNTYQIYIQRCDLGFKKIEIVYQDTLKTLCIVVICTLPVSDFIAIDGNITPTLCSIYHGRDSVSLLKLSTCCYVLPVTAYFSHFEATVSWNKVSRHVMLVIIIIIIIIVIDTIYCRPMDAQIVSSD